MDAIDKLLEEIKTEYTGEKKPKQPLPQPTNNQSFTIFTSQSDPLIDSLLADVKADFSAQDAAEELRKQQEAEQEKIRLAQIEAQKQEAIKNQAQSWLSKLDPLSSEGLWFESFAKSYPSKLAAAMDYLQNN
ncbi:MAG: hypothetical protein EAZ76_09550 [Nostocales cyanobacterium]|nr:MAG: hypothetical protein EAZ87_02165 [Nostocales cyanobacterium]TAF14479.1 MAG: hypothetical protein EAZ76_09550 [Nostocales cyanobacterium]